MKFCEVISVRSYERWCFACTQFCTVKGADSVRHSCPNWKQYNVSPMTVNLHKGPTPRKGKQHCVSDVSVFEGRRGWFQDKCRWHFSLLTQFRRKQKKPGPLLLVYFMVYRVSTMTERREITQNLQIQKFLFQKWALSNHIQKLKQHLSIGIYFLDAYNHYIIFFGKSFKKSW